MLAGLTAARCQLFYGRKLVSFFVLVQFAVNKSILLKLNERFNQREHVRPFELVFLDQTAERWSVKILKTKIVCEIRFDWKTDRCIRWNQAVHLCICALLVATSSMYNVIRYFSLSLSVCTRLIVDYHYLLSIENNVSEWHEKTKKENVKKNRSTN